MGLMREARGFTAVIPSGAGTSNSFNLQGYALAGLFVPVLTSGYIAFEVAPSAEAAFSPVYDKAGNIVSAATPGGTGGVALSSDDLTPLAGYFGPCRISASVAQGAARTLVGHLKG